MRLLYVFAAILALSLAESEKEPKTYEDSEAAESIELQKQDLKPEASNYPRTSVPTYPPWNKPQYVPQTSWPNNQNYAPPYVPSPQHPPVQSDYVPPAQHDYVPQNPHYQYPTTTPVAVYKNEQYTDGNGNYKYEYQIADGTWVGEQGYYTSPKKDDESLVKKGWYQFKGADGKVYTVTYWADHTGYHAYGDHLPTPGYATQKPIYYDPPQTPVTQKPIYYDPPQAPITQKPVYYDPPQSPATQKPIYYDPYPPQYPSQPPQQTHYPANPPPQNPTYPPQQPQYPQYNYPTGH